MEKKLGENILSGIVKGFLENIGTGWKWAWDNLAKPLCDGFCDALGIHSPSTVFAGYGENIVQGLLNGINNLVDKVKQIWENIKNTAVQKFTDIKNSIGNIWQQVTIKTSETWQTIKK